MADPNQDPNAANPQQPASPNTPASGAAPVRSAGPRVAPAQVAPAPTPATGVAGANAANGGSGAAAGGAPARAPAARTSGPAGGFVPPPQPPTPGYGVPQQQQPAPYVAPLTPGYGVPQQTPGYPQPAAPQPNPGPYRVSPGFATPGQFAPQQAPQQPRVWGPAPMYPQAPQRQYGVQPQSGGYVTPMPQVAPTVAYPAYDLRNVHFRYPGAQFELFVPQLTIPSGKLVYIGGEAGCGKSTLMKLLALQTKPGVGDIWLLGMHTSNLSDAELDDTRGGGIVYVPQGDLGLTDHVPVEGIKRLLHDFDGLSWEEAERRALAGLQAAQFPAGRLGVKASNLSGGEKARVAIGKVYATQRPICLTDEVLGPLNERLRLLVVQLFQQLADQGFTVICIEHQPQLTDYFDQVVTLDSGRILSVVGERDRPRKAVTATTKP